MRRDATRYAEGMGFLDKIKDAFASSPRAQFLGDDGSLLVLRADGIDRKTAQSVATLALEGLRAELSPAADLLTIVSEKTETTWTIPVGSKAAQASAAALFVNKVNMAASGPNYSVATFVHGK